MKKLWSRYKNSAILLYIKRHEKYAPIIFFIGGFIFDTLTLGRIDRLYDLIVLSTHMTLLTITIYLFNLVDEGKFKSAFIEHNKDYFPLVIQFFFGGLSSAYVIYFSRSVSLSKTASFFVILLVLLFANEFLKKRISNKYLQFSVYFFINFIFFTFMIPVFIKEMNTFVFIISGLISLAWTLTLILVIYYKSPSTQIEIKLTKIVGIILTIYILINTFYILKIIPPVPLALEHGIVAHDIKLDGNKYVVTHERDNNFVFWRDHRIEFIYKPNDKVYIFTSIFAPTDLKKSIIHRWKWYNPETELWEIVEDIGFDITGGRDDGFRGYTYKSNVKTGQWKIDVITEDEELVLGIVDFEIVINPNLKPKRLVKRKF
tara:strand:+ start:2728 stop:3846 length:1119 start_codon:yes stop_codon:yes gene_type:complete